MPILLPPITIADLIAPLTIGEFLDRFWPRRHHLAQIARDRLEALLRLPELSTVPALVGTPCREIQVMFRDPLGQHRQILDLRPEQALPLYDSGATIYVHGLELGSTSIADWMRSIAHELGLPVESATCGVFASRLGLGAGPHFDAQETFVLQLRGRKRWWIAPNPELPQPAFNYVEGHPLPSGAEVPASSPPKMPTEREMIELGPGDVLFLPRGYWHTTETLEESLHLDVVIPVMTWADYVTQLFKQKLSRHEVWRRTTFGVRGGGELRQLGEAVMDEMLDRMEQDLGSD